VAPGELSELEAVMTLLEGGDEENEACRMLAKPTEVEALGHTDHVQHEADESVVSRQG
jgi:hypothetical protein